MELAELVCIILLWECVCWCCPSNSDFFGVAPTVKVPPSFSSCLLASLLVGDVGFLLAPFGGVKHCEICSGWITLVHSS